MSAAQHSPRISLNGSDSLPQISMPAAFVDGPPSRPLSEISDNSKSHKRPPTAHSLGSYKSAKGDWTSRPSSQVLDDSSSPSLHDGSDGTFNGSSSLAHLPSHKRQSSTPLGIQTLTVNLIDYALTHSQQAEARASELTSETNGAEEQTAPLSPSAKPVPMPPKKPPRLVGRPSSIESAKSGKRESKGEKFSLERPQTMVVSLNDDVSQDDLHPLLAATRASLRSSGVAPSLIIASSSERLSPRSVSSPPSPSLIESQEGHDIVSPAELPRPTTRLKPSWLKRASISSIPRSKSKSPVQASETPMGPPALPPRQPKASSGPTTPQESSGSRSPPTLPPRSISSGRSKLAGGEGRPALAPDNSSSFHGSTNPPISRNRFQAWSAATDPSSSWSSTETSDFQTTLASTTSQLRGHSRTASRVLGSAGSVVQKGIAGLRSKGASGSISSMSSLAQYRKTSPDFGSSWASGLNRFGTGERSSHKPSETVRRDSAGVQFVKGSVLRPSSSTCGKVFGRDLTDVGKEWGAMPPTADLSDESEWFQARQRSLPAVVIRCVDYLEIYGPQEEGIFRISGGAKLVAQLRREFDGGADIDLTQSTPVVIDPHAVSTLLKSYIRELPSPPLTRRLDPEFEAWTRARNNSDLDRESSSQDPDAESEKELHELVQQLPIANWCLLADILKLLDLVHSNIAVTRMSITALLTSFHNSLQINGMVLQELLRRRKSLFLQPPTSSRKAIESFADLENNPVSLPPIVPSFSAPSFKPTFSVLAPEDLRSAGDEFKKRSTALPSKKSFTRLFDLKRKESQETLKSAADSSSYSSVNHGTPPIIDLPLKNTPPLPTFELISDNNHNRTEVLAATDLPSQTMNTQKVTDIHYAPGTVENRAKLFSQSTPIADRFAGTGLPFPPLRAPVTASKSIAVAERSRDSSPRPPSTEAMLSSADSIMRRGPPVFFSSSGGERHWHARSHSVGSPSLGITKVSRSPSPAATSTPVESKADHVEVIGLLEKESDVSSKGDGLAALGLQSGAAGDA